MSLPNAGACLSDIVVPVFPLAMEFQGDAIELSKLLWHAKGVQFIATPRDDNDVSALANQLFRYSIKLLGIHKVSQPQQSMEEQPHFNVGDRVWLQPLYHITACSQSGIEEMLWKKCYVCWFCKLG